MYIAGQKTNNDDREFLIWGQFLYGVACQELSQRDKDTLVRQYTLNTKEEVIRVISLYFLEFSDFTSNSYSQTVYHIFQNVNVGLVLLNTVIAANLFFV